MVAGQTVLVITDQKIINGSLNIVLDGVVLQKGMTGVISYTVAYAPDGSSMTINILNLDPDNPNINYGVSNGQKYTFTYTKTVDG